MKKLRKKLPRILIWCVPSQIPLKKFPQDIDMVGAPLTPS